MMIDVQRFVPPCQISSRRQINIGKIYISASARAMYEGDAGSLDESTRATAHASVDLAQVTWVGLW